MVFSHGKTPDVRSMSVQAVFQGAELNLKNA